MRLQQIFAIDGTWCCSSCGKIVSFQTAKGEHAYDLSPICGVEIMTAQSAYIRLINHEAAPKRMRPVEAEISDKREWLESKKEKDGK